MLAGVATLYLIPTPCNVGILDHKQATLGKHFEPEYNLNYTRAECDSNYTHSGF